MYESLNQPANGQHPATHGHQNNATTMSGRAVHVRGKRRKQKTTYKEAQDLLYQEEEVRIKRLFSALFVCCSCAVRVLLGRVEAVLTASVLRECVDSSFWLAGPIPA